MRPLIALPSRCTDSADTWRVPATALGRTYQDAIIRAGGAPVAVPPLFDDIDVDDAATDVMARVDALCLPGGPDVSPHRYGVERLHPRLIKVCHEHDAIDLALARAAIALQKPVLAICRGHQVLNVALGGTLHQHLPDVVGRRRAADHYHSHHDVDVDAGSKTAAAMGTTRPVATASTTRRSIASALGSSSRRGRTRSSKGSSFPTSGSSACNGTRRTPPAPTRSSRVSSTPSSRRRAKPSPARDP